MFQFPAALEHLVLLTTSALPFAQEFSFVIEKPFCITYSRLQYVYLLYHFIYIENRCKEIILLQMLRTILRARRVEISYVFGCFT